LFKEVSIWRFLRDTQWTPLFSDPQYGILSLACGTLVTTFVALMVSIPMGLIVAIFLSEYCSPGLREIFKPTLELLSAIPTVVYGYFALLFVTPLLQKIIPELASFNMLSAGLVMGIMILPYMASLSEDAMRAVPKALREGSYAMGATRMETAFRVVLPSAFSGLTAAFILAFSRAVGETMIVALAAGNQAELTLNPLQSAQTITAYIVQVSMGDLPHGSVGYQTIFVAGCLLFLVTYAFNILGHYLRKRYREVYN
jgi:phosphate transport system permease protein